MNTKRNNGGVGGMFQWATITIILWAKIDKDIVHDTVKDRQQHSSWRNGLQGYCAIFAIAPPLTLLGCDKIGDI